MRKSIGTLVVAAMLFVGVPATEAQAATCTLHFSYNSSSGKVTVYNTPYTSTGNKFRVKFTSMSNSITRNYPVKKGSGVAVPARFKFGSEWYGVHEMWGWRKNKACAHSPQFFGGVG